MATNTIESVSDQIRHLLTGEFDELNESTIGILLCVPLIILLVALYIYPIAQAFIFSLNRISLFATGGEFIGFENYLNFLSNPRFYNALTNGVIYTVGSTMLTLIIGVGTALILNRSFFGERFITGLVLSPYLIPVVGIVIIFRWFFNGLTGVANYAFVWLGIIENPIAWFSNPTYAMPVLILISGWALYPFVTLLVLAKLQTIPQEYYEAADLMGASRFQQFRSITLPQLYSVLFVAVLLRMLWTFNLFDIIWIGTQGGPGTATETLPVMAYRLAFDGLNLGEGAAIAFLTFLVLAAGTSIYFKLFGQEGGV